MKAFHLELSWAIFAISSPFQAALSVCEYSLTYTCERRKFFNQLAIKMIAKDYRADDQRRKDRRALLRALKPFGLAALAGIAFGALLALLILF